MEQRKQVMGFARSFRDLEVYQKALQLAVDVHAFCKTLPPEEKYVLADQMRRASRSVCANISEAWRKRRYRAAFIAKLSDSETEAAEMQCWLDFALKLNYLQRPEYVVFDEQYEQVIAQLVRMITDADKWCTLDR
jgi:four helix bundle protein